MTDLRALTNGASLHAIAIGIVLLLGLCSCKRERRDSVLGVRSELQQLVRNMESHPTGEDSQKNTLRLMREAIQKLNGKTKRNLHEPFPVTAELLGTYFSDDGLSLAIYWVDPGFEATGIYILTSDGREIVFDHVIDWDALTRVALADDSLLRVGFPVEFDERTTNAWVGVKELRPPLKIDFDSCDKGAKVGLITSEGRRTETVTIFVDTVAREHATTRPTGTKIPPP